MHGISVELMASKATLTNTGDVVTISLTRDAEPQEVNHQSPTRWATMSKGQRVALTAAVLVAFGLGITWFIYPDELVLRFDFGLAEIEIYKRAAPIWLLVIGLCATVVLLAYWWRHRKPN